MCMYDIYYSHQDRFSSFDINSEFYDTLSLLSNKENANKISFYFLFLSFVATFNKLFIYSYLPYLYTPTLINTFHWRVNIYLIDFFKYFIYKRTFYYRAKSLWRKERWFYFWEILKMIALKLKLDHRKVANNIELIFGIRKVLGTSIFF